MAKMTNRAKAAPGKTMLRFLSCNDWKLRGDKSHRVCCKDKLFAFLRFYDRRLMLSGQHSGQHEASRQEVTSYQERLILRDRGIAAIELFANTNDHRFVLYDNAQDKRQVRGLGKTLT